MLAPAAASRAPGGQPLPGGLVLLALALLLSGGTAVVAREAAPDLPAVAGFRLEDGSTVLPHVAGPTLLDRPDVAKGWRYVRLDSVVRDGRAAAAYGLVRRDAPRTAVPDQVDFVDPATGLLLGGARAEDESEPPDRVPQKADTCAPER